MKKFFAIYLTSITVVVGLVLGVWVIAEFFAWLSTFGVRIAGIVAVLLFLAVVSALTAAMPNDFRPP